MKDGLTVIPWCCHLDEKWSLKRGATPSWLVQPSTKLVPSSQGGLLHHLEFADWCSKTLALPARIPISLGSHRILFPACKKPSVLHTSWLHLALWHSLSHSCGYCALSELIIVTGVLKTDIPMWNYGNINQLLGVRSRWSVQRRLPVTIQLVHDEQRFAGSSREGGGIGVEGKIQESAGQWKKQNSTYGDEVVSTVAPSSPKGCLCRNA